MLVSRALTTLVLAAGLLVAGCGSQTETPPGSAPSTTSPQEFELSDPSNPPDDDGASVAPIAPDAGALPLGLVPEALTQRAEVQAAVTDLAQRKDVPVEEVTIAGHANVTWSDGSIGCPQKGMQYTMALVPGEQLILQVDGTYVSYHKGKAATFSYCANPTPPASTEASSR